MFLIHVPHVLLFYPPDILHSWLLHSCSFILYCSHSSRFCSLLITFCSPTHLSSQCWSSAAYLPAPLLFLTSGYNADAFFFLPQVIICPFYLFFAVCYIWVTCFSQSHFSHYSYVDPLSSLRSKNVSPFPVSLHLKSLPFSSLASILLGAPQRPSICYCFPRCTLFYLLFIRLTIFSFSPSHPWHHRIHLCPAVLPFCFLLIYPIPYATLKLLFHFFF